MSTYIDKINRIDDIKNQLKETLVQKGADISDSTSFRDYATELRNITSAGTSEEGKLLSVRAQNLSEVDLDVSEGPLHFTQFIKSIDWTGFNTLQLTSMPGMFAFINPRLMTGESGEPPVDENGMPTLDSIHVADFYLDVANLDVSQVTSTALMFMYSGVVHLDLSSWNTENVTDVANMFIYCLPLKSLNLSNFNTSNIIEDEENGKGSFGMFDACYSLKNVTFGDNWMGNPSTTSFNMQYSPLSKESILDLANKIADKNSLSSAATVTLRSSQQSLFTEDELVSLANTFTSKNWTLSWG